MAGNKRIQLVLGILIVLFIGLGVSFALKTGTFNAPDERMHFNNIKVVSEGRLSVLTPEKVTKEGHQPPLYYFLSSPVYSATKGWPLEWNVFAVRIFSLLISSFTIVFTYLLIKRLFPNRATLSLAAAAVVALNPQFIFMSSVVNNDALANALGAVLLFLLASIIKKETLTSRIIWLAGLVSVLAFLTKSALWPLVIILIIVLLYKGKEQIKQVIIPLLPLAAVAFLWLTRNWSLYGDPTVMSYMRQLWYDEQHKSFLNFAGLKQWFITLYESFWARFGYFDLALRPIFYLLFKILALTSLAGVIKYGFTKFKALEKPDKIILKLLVAAFIIVLAGTFIFSLNFYQPQGRYLFPVISAISLFLVLGLEELLPKFLRKYVLALFIIFLMIANFQSLTILK